MQQHANTTQEVDLLISAGCIITMNAERQIILDGAVAVNGSDIVAIGDAQSIRARYRGRKTIEAPRGLLTPGLVDVHNHPIDHLIKGLVDDLPQLQRLKERVIPFEDGLTEQEAYVASAATYFEMIRHGTTSFMDAAGPHPAAVGNAALRVGMRGIISCKMADLPGPFGGVAADPQHMIALADKTFDQFNGAGNGLLRGGYDIDFSPIVSDALAQLVRDHAHERNAPITGHLIGRRPAPGDAAGYRNPDVKRYADLGLLGPRTTLAHIGWIPAEDVEVFAQTGTNVAHCPSASLLGGNGWVTHGVIPDLLAAGVNVALGTDAAIISRFLDMVRVMHLASTAHKDARLDPMLMPAYQVFEMATLGSAKAMGWSDRIGSLEVGKAADLVIFDASGPQWMPNRFSNPVPDLVYGSSGSDAQTVVINGVIVMEDKKFTDSALYQEIEAAVDIAAADVLGRLGIYPKVHWPVTDGRADSDAAKQ
ncbi:amidohydrolase family protein [Duganella phyllosphaerae]|uniref:5-methylthioadenosine/S-adenosylhomocysteine deaminase n=1 Tax=Duganella phyllosphaerae TaxID=762836 RepID=A0A1E7WUW5_9BURK|nr:amidohydrolase family protein [Duganella phyllosphaerae]OFA03493.1 5-methylthioadenosine/S-adenosylhomocysteine deaminase [Duganella phyllosphaerae]